MNIAQLWNGTQDKLSDPIFRAIDKRLASALKLRGQVEHLWRKLQQPIRLGRNPESWLLLAPERLRVTPLRTVDGNLVISLAADVRAHVVVGSAPAAPASIVKLPPPEVLAAPANTFAVSVPVTLSYADAARIAIQHLRKKPLRVGKSQ